jgi:hypothetical protein
MLAEIFLVHLQVRRQLAAAPAPNATARDPRFVPYKPSR